MSHSNKLSLKDPQIIIAVGVTIISLCALIVSVQQTKLMQEESELLREYSRASVWPRLDLGIGKGHNMEDDRINQLEIYLSNNGVGPAIITDVKVSYKGEVAKDWWHLFELQGVPDSIETYITNEGFNGQIIKIGESVTVLSLNNNLPLAQAFYERAEGLEIDIYYESIYKEKWHYSSEGTKKLENFEGLPDEAQFGS